MHERSCLRAAACRRTRAHLLSFAALHATQTTVPYFLDMPVVFEPEYEALWHMFAADSSTVAEKNRALLVGTTSARTGEDTSLVARVVIGCAVKQAANDCNSNCAAGERSPHLCD